MSSTSDSRELRSWFLEDLLIDFSKLKLITDSLKERKQVYNLFFASQYHSFRLRASRRVLASNNADNIVSEHSAWMDAWIHFTWKFALEETKLIMREVLRVSDQKLPYLEKTLPEKRNRKKELERFIALNKEEAYISSSISYYQNTLKNIVREIVDLEKELNVLREIIPQMSAAPPGEAKLRRVLLIFARGSYGRRELSFSSDIDIGYCVDVDGLSKLEIQTIQELIKRMEELFQAVSLDVASQYLELGENLSRFAETEKLHAIPSIFEGRAIVGDKKKLKELKKQLMNACPLEKITRYLKKQLDDLSANKDKVFHIKEGLGGIRHLQLALWIALTVEDDDSGGACFVLDRLRKKEWISLNDKTDLLQALEFYLDLRNFLGLCEFYRKDLEAIGASELCERKDASAGILDDKVRLAYLKLKKRFADVDDMERFCMHSQLKVQTLAETIVKKALNHAVIEPLPNFVLHKHLGTNQITKLEKTQSSSNGKIRLNNQETEFFNLFIEFENICRLFQYIAQTGSRLSKKLESAFSFLLPQLYEHFPSEPNRMLCVFVFELFKADHASEAVSQMMEIAAPLRYDGKIKTLLGLFFPETNEMRYLIRNTEIHEFPLCVHSLKALRQVEEEIDIMKNKEPELWLYIKEEDIFVLKWSVFFHDLGKIESNKNHEKLGAELSTRMLTRLGWDPDCDMLTSTRFLISNHQSVVRFSRLATYPDLAILKFVELGRRDPAKVILLYLINLSDFKSVNSEFKQKAGPLERLFQKTVGIMEEFKHKQFPGSIIRTVKNYLDRQVEETGFSVLIELLAQQCHNQSLEDTIIKPLKKLAPEEMSSLNRYYKDLNSSIGFLKAGELDADSLAKHKRHVRLIIKQTVSKETILAMASPLAKSWDWFFKALPNRYLLSSKVDVLASQVRRFESERFQKARFSFIKGEAGEYDTLIFQCDGGLEIQSMIAYVVSWKGFNIENGKINKVTYLGQKNDIVGFFALSRPGGEVSELSNLELQNIINNMKIIPLTPGLKPVSNIKIDFFDEDTKGYLVTEVEKSKFRRTQKKFSVIKISLRDAHFCFYKILRAFREIGVVPQQSAITTIGDQIIDYFYVSPEEKDKILGSDFKILLQSYIDGEIRLS